MALTKAARSKIFTMVQEVKKLLVLEVASQLQQFYGIRPDGSILLVEQLPATEPAILHTARLLRQRIDYIKSNIPSEKNKEVEAIKQLLNEQAFSILNRFAALRMAEERGIIKETIRKEYNSEGFQIFDSITSQGAVAEQYTRYKWYLHSIFDELSMDLPSIFDRFSPYALIFPNEKVMRSLLTLINNETVTMHREDGKQPVNLWREDEILGWIYQYYNSREEISEMRDASDAPRNSRELAVRNQFFTPRYVVQFLTDNSLGRIWYEMTKGKTELIDKCQYLIRKTKELFLDKENTRPENTEENTDFVKHRPIKDPREIFMLDPACGSMHFGLYSFDLFEQIYAEAWDNHPELMIDLRNSITRKQYINQIPEFIIRYNIHGVDIDPRALQIAALSLWLRAQKSFEKLNLDTGERPQITKSNLVLAEAMPGNVDLLSALVKPLDAPLRKLVTAIWDLMQMAGEVGFLLRIEQEIDERINEIAKELTKNAKESQLELNSDFEQLKVAEQAALYSTKKYRDLFLKNASTEVFKILKQLAEKSSNGEAFEKLLFADDAARGFAFIELCNKKYDVVLMNPPFGLGLRKNYNWMQSEYPDSYTDLLAAFVQRGFELSSSHVGAITSRSILVTPKLERIRLNTLINHFSTIVDLGSPVMDNAMVQSAAYILSKSSNQKSFVVVDRKQHKNKNHELASSLNQEYSDDYRYIVDREMFFHTPRYKILYNLPFSVLNLFKDNRRLNELGINAKQGMKSFDDFRFVRIRQEVLPKDIGKHEKWRSYSKGGEYSLFYSDLKVLIRYENDGIEVQEVNRERNGMTAQARQASTLYYLAGGNFSRRCKDFGVRMLPMNFVIGEKGPIIISENRKLSNILVIGLLNSSFYNYLVNIQANANQYDTGIIESLPYIDLSDEDLLLIERTTTNAINSLREFDGFREETSLFQTMPLGSSVNEINSQILKFSDNAESSIEHALSSIDKIIDTVLGINSVELLTKISEFNEEGTAGPISYNEKAVSVISNPSELELSRRLISFAFGVLIGRWHHPAYYDKVIFDNENLFQNYNGKVPGFYDTKSKDVLFVVTSEKSDLTFESDIVGIIESIWNSNTVNYELLDLISYPSFTSYFLNPIGFFDYHLTLYTASRRMAPIYWPISSSSGSYTVWLYYPKLTDQTLVSILNNNLQPKIDHVNSEIKLFANNSNLDNNSLKALTALRELEHELEEMKKEIIKITALPYKPNHDDGVLITAAPLHNLFRHSKWRKSTEDCWKAFEKGEYDWAQLAYSIWPDRVSKKCKKDLSMAIAHGLENICEIKLKEKKVKATKVSIKGNVNPQLNFEE